MTIESVRSRLFVSRSGGDAKRDFSPALFDNLQVEVVMYWVCFVGELFELLSFSWSRKLLALMFWLDASTLFYAQEMVVRHGYW